MLLHSRERSTGAPRGYPGAFLEGVRAAGLPFPPAAAAVVTSADLDPLPVAARRYLRFMGVLGRPRDRSFRARMIGRFRLRPGGAWMRCAAWQYNTADPVARLFRMRLMLGGAVPMTGWDTYRHGHGRMRGSLLGLIPVARGSGPRFDTSELVTWLDDALLMAPSMLLGPATTWSDGADADAFRVSFTDAGQTVAAEVLLAADGSPREVRTDDRYADLPGGWCGRAGAPRSTAGGSSMGERSSRSHRGVQPPAGLRLPAPRQRLCDRRSRPAHRISRCRPRSRRPRSTTSSPGPRPMGLHPASLLTSASSDITVLQSDRQVRMASTTGLGSRARHERTDQ